MRNIMVPSHNRGNFPRSIFYGRFYVATAPIGGGVDGDTLSQHRMLSIIVRQKREAASAS